MLRKFSILLLIILEINIHASETEEIQDIDFRWALGAIKLYNGNQNRPNIELGALKFNWFLDEKYIVGFDIINFGQANDIVYVAVLPIELSYILWNFKINDNSKLYFTINNKIGFQEEGKRNIENKPFYSIGSQLFVLYNKPYSSNMPYSFFSLYADYNISHGLKFGFGFNTPLWFWGILLAIMSDGRKGPGA